MQYSSICTIGLTHHTIVLGICIRKLGLFGLVHEAFKVLYHPRFAISLSNWLALVLIFSSIRCQDGGFFDDEGL